MREQDQQIQQAQQGQQSQQSYQQTNGQDMSNLEVANSEEKQGDSSIAGSGGSATVIIIAINAGGNSETQQMNAAVQPPMATHTVWYNGFEVLAIEH